MKYVIIVFGGLAEITIAYLKGKSCLGYTVFTIYLEVHVAYGIQPPDRPSPI